MVPIKTTANSTVWANRSNGQLLTHSNHLGTHLDGEIHFFTPGKDIASLGLNDFLTGPAAVVDLSDATGDYQIYTADPMNTIIRNWMPRQAAEADKLFRAMYGTTMEERLTDDKYQLMHIEMFPYHIIHAQCLSGDIDLLRSVALFAVCNRPAAPPSAFRGARGGSWTASRAQARRPPGRPLRGVRRRRRVRGDDGAQGRLAQVAVRGWLQSRARGEHTEVDQAVLDAAHLPGSLCGFQEGALTPPPLDSTGAQSHHVGFTYVIPASPEEGRTIDGHS